LTQTEPQNTGEPANRMSGAGKALTNELLVREYTSAVYGLCLAYTRNIHDAEDAVQDVFLKAFAKLHTLKDSACIRSWLLKIARRTCIDKHRKGLATDAILQKACTTPGSADDEIRCLHQALSELPEQYRETIFLYYLDGRSCANIAQSLGISEMAVRQRLVRGRTMLQDLFLEDQQ